MRYKLLYEIIMFCWSYRQLAEALWMSLCCIRCKCQIIALLYRYTIAIAARAIVGETTMWWHIWYRSRWWRSWCRAGDDKDHDSTLEMEIKGTRWWWPYHVTYFDCIWCLSIIHLIPALIDGSILRWSLTNYQEVFSLSMHRCESSSCWDTMWWSGVIGSMFKYNGCKTVAHAEYSGYTWRA